MSSFVVEASWGSSDRVLFVSVVRAGSAVPSGWGWLGTYWLRPPVWLERVGYVLIMSSCPVGTGLECIDYVFLSGWTGLGTY